MRDLSNLVPDIYRLLENNKLSDPGLIDKYAKQIGEVLLKRFSREERSPTLRMSNLGKQNRQLYYELNGYKGEDLSGQTLLKFSFGDAVEALLIFLAEAAGYKAERFQEEVSHDGVLGHIDLVLEGHVVDIKSCSAYGFQKFKTGSLLEEGNDPFAYKTQLSAYAKILGLPAAWLAFDKQSGEICVLELPEKDILSFDLSGRIAEVRDIVGRSTPPEKCFPDELHDKSGGRRLGTECSYCNHKFTCHSDANDGTGLRVFQYSNKPVYMTYVGSKPPKVFEITNNKKENILN